MTNKKLQTVHVITNRMSRQLDAIFIKKFRAILEELK